MGNLRYEPLVASDEIRILDLLPGKGPISCCLQSVRLSEEPEFEALSYCWGTSTKKRTIIVDGHHLSVSKGLYSALQYLRPETGNHRPMWIDAVCINQVDTAEKNIQVPIMTKIYKQCTRGVIWLGEPNILTRRAFRVLRVTMEYANSWPLGWPFVPMNCWRHAEFNLGQTTGRTQRSDMNLRQNWVWDRLYDSLALSHLWERPWFDRVWILQEAALCPDGILKCGADEISWVQFSNYCARGATPAREIEPTAQRPCLQRNALKRDIPIDLFDAFTMAEKSSVTDPRDKIYGVLAFVKHHDYIQIEVDYSHDASRVFLDFTIEVLRTRPNLDVLSRSQGVQKSRTDLPTWSLSWNYTEGQQWFGHTFAGYNTWNVTSQSIARATDMSNPRVEFLDDGKVLGLHGAMFDEVVAVGRPMFDRDSDFWRGLDWLRAYISWRDVSQLDFPTLYEPTGQPRSEMVWRLLRWFDLRTDDLEEENERFAEFDALVVRLTSLLPRHLLGLQIGLILLIIWDLFITLAYNSGVYTEQPSWLFEATAGWGRRMFRTSRGYVGLGLPPIEVGDKIFLLRGSRAPFIFRKRGERWLLVSEACVHGIMDGEAFNGDEDKMIWVE